MNPVVGADANARRAVIESHVVFGRITLAKDERLTTHDARAEAKLGNGAEEPIRVASLDAIIFIAHASVFEAGRCATLAGDRHGSSRRSEVNVLAACLYHRTSTFETRE